MGKKVNPENDERVVALIRELIDERPSYGYRRVTAKLRFKGEKITPKRVYRLMKKNSLLLQKYGAKPSRSHTGKIETIASNIRWCSDGFGIQCFNREQLQVAYSLDCHDREIMSWVTSSKGIDHGLICDLMTDTIEERFGSVDTIPHPVQWLSDNGSMYTAHETVRYGRSRGLDIRTTPAYSPESNGTGMHYRRT